MGAANIGDYMNFARYKKSRYVKSAWDSDKNIYVYINLMNSALLHVKKEDRDVIEVVLNDPNNFSHQQEFFTKEVYDLLILHKFLIGVCIDELSILEHKYHQQRSAARAGIGVVTSLRCNLRCSYCYQKHENECITHEEEKVILSFVKQTIPRIKRLDFTWWGGEPLLEISLIERMSRQIIKICSSFGVDYSAYTATNGTMLSESVCKTLRRCMLNRFQITIDGPQEYHDNQRFTNGGKGTYYQILCGLENLSRIYEDFGRFITIRINITSSMLSSSLLWNKFFQDLMPFQKYIALNFHNVLSNEFFPDDKMINFDDFKKIYSGLTSEARSRGFALLNQETSPGQLYCGALFHNNWIILPGLRLTKCTDTFHDRSSDCGKLNLDGSILFYDKYDKWRNYNPFELEMCQNCDVLPICMGGCKILPFTSKNGGRCFRKAIIENKIIYDTRRIKEYDESLKER